MEQYTLDSVLFACFHSAPMPTWIHPSSTWLLVYTIILGQRSNKKQALTDQNLKTGNILTKQQNTKKRYAFRATSIHRRQTVSSKARQQLRARSHLAGGLAHTPIQPRATPPPHRENTAPPARLPAQADIARPPARSGRGLSLLPLSAPPPAPPR